LSREDLVAAAPGPERREEPGTPWKVPSGPLNVSIAVRSAGTVAAPLLAGFSFTLAGLVLQLPSQIIRWPDLALLLFVMAGFFLVACIQFAFWAERWNISPDDIRMWWPGFDENEALSRYLYAKQAYHAERYDRWVGFVRLTYNSGIVAFLAAIAVMLVPPGPLNKISVLRVTAIAVSMVALVVEAIWVATSGPRGRRETEGGRAPANS
jgi:hypothetical protein